MGEGMKRISPAASGIAVALVLSAGGLGLQSCTTESVSNGVVTVDSAGVTIVSSDQPVWGDSGWMMSGQPWLQIGVVEGDSAYQLYRVQAALRLSDGRIVVANDGSRELRYFDSTGTHLSSTGRSGQGPGEFMNLYTLIPGRADTIIAGDFTLQRISIFDAAGAFVRTRPVQSPVGVLADGSIIAQVNRSWPDRTIENGPSRSQSVLIRHPNGEADPDTLAFVEGSELVTVVQSDGRTTGATGYARPFGLTRMTSVSGGEIYTADGASAEVRVLDASGALRRIYRFDRSPAEVTAQDREAYRERFLDPIPPGPFRNRAESALEGDAFPSHMPVFQAMRHDRAGNLWLEDYRADPSASPRWTILDSSGRWLGSVTTPAGLRVLDIGADYLLGVTRDELDVEHVLLYGLDRTEPGAR